MAVRSVRNIKWANLESILVPGINPGILGNLFFFFTKAKFSSIAIATVEDFNAGKGKKKETKTRVSIWKEYKCNF